MRAIELICEKAKSAFFPKCVVVVVMLVAGTTMSEAQSYGKSSSVGVNLMYDMQLKNLNGKGVHANAAASLFVEKPVVYSWSFRFYADVYGIMKQKGYDRCAAAGVGLLLNLNNALTGEWRRGTVYAMVGAAGIYAADGISGIGLAADAGVGYSFWLTGKVRLHAEGQFMMSGSNVRAVSFGIGGSAMM